ncbi:hypothetical protein AHAS_Ahas12G0032700 [Arachis hypogaea]
MKESKQVSLTLPCFRAFTTSRLSHSKMTSLKQQSFTNFTPKYATSAFVSWACTLKEIFHIVAAKTREFGGAFHLLLDFASRFLALHS